MLFNSSFIMYASQEDNLNDFKETWFHVLLSCTQILHGNWLSYKI